ncbi:hypothetical protein CIT14_22220, partial [Virgibacillus profundi]
ARFGHGGSGTGGGDRVPGVRVRAARMSAVADPGEQAPGVPRRPPTGRTRTPQAGPLSRRAEQAGGRPGADLPGAALCGGRPGCRDLPAHRDRPGLWCGGDLADAARDRSRRRLTADLVRPVRLPARRR